MYYTFHKNLRTIARNDSFWDFVRDYSVINEDISDSLVVTIALLISLVCLV